MSLPGHLRGFLISTKDLNAGLHGLQRARSFVLVHLGALDVNLGVTPNLKQKDCRVEQGGRISLLIPQMWPPEGAREE